MAKSDGSVIIETLMDTDGFEDGLKKLEKDIDNSKDKLGGLSEPLKDVAPTLDDISGKMKDVGGTMAKVGVGMTATLTTPLVMLGKEMVSSASDMEENLNKVDVAFGKSAESVKKWADSSTESFGLSKNQALEATSLYGDMATSMGITQKDASEMATTLAGLSGDLQRPSTGFSKWASTAKMRRDSVTTEGSCSAETKKICSKKTSSLWTSPR